MFYITVKNDQIGHMSAQLGGLRKGDSIYFSLDKMEEAEMSSLLILKVIFFVTLSITLFWLRLTYVIFMSLFLPIAGYYFYRIGFREIKINKSWHIVFKAC